MLFPQVKERECNGGFSLGRSAAICVRDIGEFDLKTVKTVFGAVSDNGDIALYCKRNEALAELSEEAYSLDIREENGILHINASAPCERAFIRALFTLKRMLLKDSFPLGKITDYPSFAVRGYIEGFYGKPWSSSQRLEMLELMALYGENTHYYAPKDDPYHREKWMELYPQDKAEEINQLVSRARELYMDFYYCIAPGLSMCYSSASDFEALKEKTRQLFSMGISDFGLLLDDIPPELYYEEDRINFGSASFAHAELTKKYFSFLKSLSPVCRLTVCPTAYHGKGNEGELTDFALNIPAEVNVFYTGDDICSKELTCREADVFYKNTRHKPLYWDNYPVNDAEMFMEMHMGPIIGREKELYEHSVGIISNCSEYFNCNKIPLITVASYLWNPHEYDAEKAYYEAVNAVLPSQETEDFILFADHLRTSCLHDENSRIMGEHFALANMHRYGKDNETAMKIITEYTEKNLLAAGRLKKCSAPIYTELSRWLGKYYLMCDILLLALKALRGEEVKDELKKLMEEYNESATVLTAFCFREYIEGVLSDEN